MKIIAKTDIGLVRATNEDTYTIIEKDENNFIAFVCDGMGGHLGGSFASSKTVQMIEEEFNKKKGTRAERSLKDISIGAKWKNSPITIGICCLPNSRSLQCIAI